MRRHNPRLFRISRAYGNDEDEAEDIVQQAHINAYEHLSSFEGRARFSTCLTRIVIREAMGRIKKRRRSVLLQPEFSAAGEEYGQLQLRASTSENPEETVMNQELREILERTIGRLPVKYRSVFVMREIEEMSVEETGESLGISAANVKVRLNRAKEMLRSGIGPLYHDAGVYHFNLVRCDRIVAAVLSRVRRYETSDHLA
jgi:RNA polymerase sigma-70 factor (ECF subfamily)